MQAAAQPHLSLPPGTLPGHVDEGCSLRSWVWSHQGLSGTVLSSVASGDYLLRAALFSPHRSTVVSMEAEMPGLTSGPRARGPADEWNLMDNRAALRWTRLARRWFLSRRC